MFLLSLILNANLCFGLHFVFWKGKFRHFRSVDYGTATFPLGRFQLVRNSVCRGAVVMPSGAARSDNIVRVVSSGSWRLTGHLLHSPDEWPYADIPARLFSLPILLGTEGFVPLGFCVLDCMETTTRVECTTVTEFSITGLESQR